LCFLNLLMRFIDWVIEIPKELEPLFDKELEKFEKEEKVYYITQMQRPSYEKGQQEGEKKGIAKIISKLIAKKFNSQVRRELPRLRNLPQDDLMELAEQILVIKSLTAVHDWINTRKQINKK